MRISVFFVLFYLLNSSLAVSQEFTNKDILGLYYGKMRMEGSISGQDIALKFYEDGEVIASVLSKRPTKIDNFIKSFDRKSKQKYSLGKYKITGNTIEFNLQVSLKGSKYKLLFKGRLSFSKTVQVMLFTIINRTNKKEYRLYSERVWMPYGEAKSKIFKQEDIMGAPLEEDVPSKMENNKNISVQLGKLDENIENEDFEAATGNLNNIGLSYFDNKDYEEAVKNFDEALVMSELSGDKKASANILNNLGVSHERLNHKKSAILHFEKAKTHFDELGDKVSAAKVLFQIASLEHNYLNKDGEKEALERLIGLEKEINNKEELSATYNNLAISLKKLKKDKKAFEMLQKSMDLDKELGKNNLLAISINNKGNMEFEAGNYQEALRLYNKALKIKNTFPDKKSKAITLHNMGNALYAIGELDSANVLLKSSLAMSKETKDAKTINANYRSLANLLADKIGCSDPLNHYKSYISMRFAVVESDETKPLYEEKSKYLGSEFNSNESMSDDVKRLGIGNDDLISINMLQEDLREQQKSAELEIKEQESQILILNQSNSLLAGRNELIQEHSRTLSWIVTGGTISGLLIFALLILALRAKKRTKIDKLKIEEQKEVIEEKNKGFMDSVTYASRLQTAILPPDNLLAEQLKDFFVLYKPKDIVAGDFYWTEKVGNYTFVAAADCTGHGVPGAMVSVVCSNSLFRAVNEFGLRNTGEILDKVRDLVIQTFEKSVEEVKDGMDISLVRLEENSNEIQYTGANNSLIIVRDRELQKELTDKSVYNDKKVLEEFKADKQPVGQYQYAKSFSTNIIEIFEGDQLFLYSDGYADQFGGVKGKKLKVRALKELFLEVSTLSLNEQKEKLEKSFEEWRKDFEQIDDVCILGVKV